MVFLQIIGALIITLAMDPKDLNGFYRVFSGSNGRYRVLPSFS